MAETKLTLFIIDDNILKIPEYVELSLYDEKLDAASLRYLADSAEWPGHRNLKQLTSDILNSEHSKSGALEVFGFTHPSICLTEIEQGLQPDVIIYDWEYGPESNIERSTWLLELLSLTSAFVFVFSEFHDEIPPYLNKSEFQEYASHLQLFEKGNSSSSIFSSEEFIFQYIVSQINKANTIKIHGSEIQFQENGYLSSPSDIIFLEKIFGEVRLLKYLEDNRGTVSTESIEKMVEMVETKLLFDTKRKLLISPESSLLIEKFQPEDEMSYLQVLRTFGLEKLIEVLETGLVKV